MIQGDRELFISEYLLNSSLRFYSVHVHIVHVSAEGVVPILEDARRERLASGYRGWRGGITAETCNHYLTLSAEDIPPGRTEFKCSPPIRNNTNKVQPSLPLRLLIYLLLCY